MSAASSSRTRHLVITFGTTIAILGLNVVTGVIIARGLGPGGRGELTAISSLPQTIGWIFAFGSIQAIAYHQARRPGDASRLIGTWLSVMAPIGVIGLIVGELLVPVLLGAQSADAIALAHVFVLLTVVGVLTNVSLGMILGDEDLSFYNLIRVLQALLTAIALVALWWVDELSVVSSLVVIAGVILASFVALSVRVLRRYSIGRPDRQLARSTTWYGLRAHGSDLGGIGTVRMDLTIIPAFLGASLVGYYAIASTVAGVFITLSGSVAGVMLSMAARDEREGSRIILRVTGALITVCGSIAAVVWILAPQAVALVYGSDFDASVTPLRILLPGAVLFGAASVVGQGLNAVNRPFTAAVGQLLGLVITVVGLVVFLPIGGIEAAAITSLVAYSTVFVVTLLLYLRVVRRLHRTPIVAREISTSPPHTTIELAPARRGSRNPPPLRRRLGGSTVLQGAGTVTLIVLASVGVGWLLSTSGVARIAIVGVLLAIFAGLGAMSARLLVPALMIWLAALGLTRRLLTEFVEPTRFDLLLLVGPSIVIALLIGTPPLRVSARRSPVTALVTALAGVTVVAGINPLNGSAVAGVAGLMFVLIPILAYWIGMRIDDSTLKASFWIVAVLACVASVYGLYQSFSGFPSWDQHWVETSGYIALNVGDTVRSFSSFSSASEYASYLAVGLTVVCAFLFRRGRWFPVLIPLIGLLGTALFLASARAIVFKMVAAVGLMIAAHRGVRFSTAVAAALVLVLLLPIAVSKIAPTNSDNALIAHQVGGLADPTNAKTSTLGVHAAIIGTALVDSVRNPVGSGLSSVTISGGRLGGGKVEVGGGVAAAETDIETAAISMGIVGLLLFLAILVLGFSRLFTLARQDSGFLPLAGLGILAVTSLQWLNGGQYAVGILPWLVLGWGEARHLRNRREAVARPTTDDADLWTARRPASIGVS